MTLKIFGAPHLYVQGPGALSELQSILSQLGNRAFIVIDPGIADMIRPKLEAGFSRSFVDAMVAHFGGECTAAEISRLTVKCRDFAPDLIVGVGGGKAIDTAKAVCLEFQRPLVIVPTISSNDAPTSRIAVIYTEDHVLSEVRRLPTNPYAVIVDTAILIEAPKRFFVAGIGDAISKKFEAAQCYSAGGDNFYSAKPPFIATHLADLCYEVIRHYAQDAVRAVQARRIDEAFERTVEATILLSGLAFENGGLSIPHSLTRGFSAVPKLASSLHGEQVAFGLLVQLFMEDRPKEFLADIYGFYREIGLPTCFADLGFTGDPREVIPVIARRTVEQGPYIRNFAKRIDARLIEAALEQANSFQ